MRACTAEEMRAIDQRAIQEFGIPSLLLMENAGAAVARRAAEIVGDPWEQGPRSGIVVLCGKGNNGGDGFVAARHLWSRGYFVMCFYVAEPETMQGDARVNAELATRLGIHSELFNPNSVMWLASGLIIDALLGTGFSGEPHGLVQAAIQKTREFNIPVLAVDVPSGVNATTGGAAEACIRATETVTFGLPKVGLLSGRGRTLAGSITVAQISLPREPLGQLTTPLVISGGDFDEEPDTDWLEFDRVQALWPSRESAAHKGDSGRLLVLAGSPGLTGAAAMAAESALRAGAGLVTVAVPSSLAGAMAVKLTEAMSLPLPETATGSHSPESLAAIRERLTGGTALAIGPGLGKDPATGELLLALLKDCPVPVVVDADGLNLLAPPPPGTFPARCMLTPHPGEMARLLETTVAEVESNRVDTARRAAERFGCVVVLKGPGTVIAAPDERVAINSTGSSALATGGTGDVLTGMVGACLARGLEPFDAAIAAVYAHGLAGEIAEERFGSPGAIAGDVIEAIPEALRRLREGKVAPPCRMI